MYKLICFAAGIALFQLQLYSQSLSSDWSFELRDELAGEPVPDQDKVFVRDEKGGVYCLNSGDGKLVWAYQNGDSRGQRLVISGPRLYFNSDAGLHCLDKATGKVLWTFDAGRYVFGGTPVVAANKVFTSNMGKDIHVVDARTGKLIRTLSTPDMGNAEFTAAGNMVFVFTEAGRLLTLNAGTLKMGWSSKVPEGPENAPLVLGDDIYAPSFSRESYCLDRKTGRKRWKYQPKDDLMGCASSLSEIPAIGRKTVCYTDGYGYALGVDQESGQETWRRQLSDGIYEKAFRFEDQFGIVTEDRLFFLDQETGAVRSEFKLPAAESGGFWFRDGRLIYGTEDHKVYSLRLPENTAAP